jgi:hypothetical protein
MKIFGYARKMCAALVLVCAAALSQSIQSIDIVEIKTGSTVQSVPEGYEITLSIHLAIKNRWHINAHETTDSYLTPTVVQFDSSKKFSVKSIIYPPAEHIKLQFSESELALYEEEAIVVARAIVERMHVKNEVKIKGFVQYQPCNDQTCLFPVKKPFAIVVKF